AAAISPAIFTERSVVSKREIGFTPLLPSRMARQKAVLPIPLGLTTPMPVMTARFSNGILCPYDKVQYSIVPALIPMSLGIYISVPFCRSKCSYCNFASGVFSAAQMEGYVDRLAQDLAGCRDFAAKHEAEMPATCDSIYLGGGTPSLLQPVQLKKLFFILRREFAVAEAAEITVECAPGTLKDDVVAALAESGVNRVSLGVQSFDDREARS